MHLLERIFGRSKVFMVIRRTGALPGNRGFFQGKRPPGLSGDAPLFLNMGGLSFSRHTATALSLFRLCRLPFLLGGLLLFFLGAYAAGDPLSEPERLLLCYLVLAAGQVSVSLSNDYFDRGADRLEMRTPISGGSGVLCSRPDLAGAARSLALILIGISLVLALICAILFPMPWYFLPFALAGNLVGWYYTAPPFALAYLGLGEAATMLTFGFFMPGAGYLAAGGVFDLSFALFILPLLFSGLFFILSVELPDREADLAAGKNNLVARYGRKNAFLVMFLAAAITSLLLPAAWSAPPQVLAASLLPVIAGAIPILRQPVDRREIVRAAEMDLAALILFVLVSCLTAAGLFA
jgi:1,4-dihydroxy-2-naphthoate octaprenyltransferase